MMKSNCPPFLPIYRNNFTISLFCRTEHTLDMIKYYAEPIYYSLFPLFIYSLKENYKNRPCAILIAFSHFRHRQLIFFSDKAHLNYAKHFAGLNFHCFCDAFSPFVKLLGKIMKIDCPPLCSAILT